MVEIFEIMDNFLPYIILGMAAMILILFILFIITIVQNRKLKKNYRQFMSGKDGKSLEAVLIRKLNEMEEVITLNEENREQMERIIESMDCTYQKVGVVKYDAFDEMGGKLSFSLALLNRMNDGFIINAMHSREGCFTYIKEIIKGNSIIILSKEEKEALEMAMGIEEDYEEQ